MGLLETRKIKDLELKEIERQIKNLQAKKGRLKKTIKELDYKIEIEGEGQQKLF